MFKKIFKVSALIIFLLFVQQFNLVSSFHTPFETEKSVDKSLNFQINLHQKANHLTASKSKNQFNKQKKKNVKAYLEEVLIKLDNIEKALQIKTKTSLDYPRLHDQQLNCLQNCTPLTGSSGTCWALNEDGAAVLKIPNSVMRPFYAFCYRTDVRSTWTVIQRRENGSVNFTRGWQDYKLGFGNVNGEYWIGLERLHALTKSRNYELQILLENFEHTQKKAIYSHFYVASENEGYKLSFGAYSGGDAGDALKEHKNSKFTTYDRGNDNLNHSVFNCAWMFKGGWWYTKCLSCNLNGKYFSESNKKHLFGGINWFTFTYESLKRVMMMIRPL